MENLRKGEIDQAEVETIKNKVSDSIKLKGVEKKAGKAVKRLPKCPSPKEKELSKQIIAFINSDNYFHQKVYQQRKSEIDSLLKNSDSSLYSSSDYYPQIIAGGIAVVGTTFVLIRFFKNRRIAAK